MRESRLFILAVCMLFIFPSISLSRDFNPQTGRYLEADPLYSGVVQRAATRLRVNVKTISPERQGNLDLYHYAGNNPITRIDALGLTWIEYDRNSARLSIHPGDLNTQGPPSAVFDAFNNAPSNRDWLPGTYDFLYWKSHPGNGSNDSMSSNGNFVFDVPGCEGCGIHAGRADSCDKAYRCGAAHATAGCIRTTDDAMWELRSIYHKNQDPILFLIVR